MERSRLNLQNPYFFINIHIFRKIVPVPLTAYFCDYHYIFAARGVIFEKNNDKICRNNRLKKGLLNVNFQSKLTQKNDCAVPRAVVFLGQGFQ